MIKRIFDIIFSLVAITFLVFPFILISIIITLTSKGPIIYWSKRVGQNNIIFMMPKFRTMKIDTPDVATHLMKDSSKYLTPMGRLFRKTSIDEIPQIYSILIGKMSFVGPRPALYNQFDLIDLRKKYEIDKLKPGLTGLAQISGRDNLSIKEKVKLDHKYMISNNLIKDLNIMYLTAIKVLRMKNVSH